MITKEALLEVLASVSRAELLMALERVIEANRLPVSVATRIYIDVREYQHRTQRGLPCQRFILQLPECKPT